MGGECSWSLAHQNRTKSIASDFHVDGAKWQKSCRKKGFGLRYRSPKSQIAGGDVPSHGGFAPLNAMQHCFLLSRKSLRFQGSAMGIAIANRKNRCDFDALSLGALQSGLLLDPPNHKIAFATTSHPDRNRAVEIQSLAVVPLQNLVMKFLLCRALGILG